MKSHPLAALFGVTIVGLVIGIGAAAAKQGIVTNLQTCGQGVTMRPDGSILIDAWKGWIIPMRSPEAPPPAVNWINPQPSETLQIDQPVAIHFGHTISGKSKQCYEEAEADGTKCVPMSEVRAFVFKTKK